MSIDSVENIHVRLRNEIERTGYKLAEASRAIGDPSPQNLKDVVAGRKKCPAELVGRLSLIGVDIFYVLTGERQAAHEPLMPEESALVENYRASTDENKYHLKAVSSALAQSSLRSVDEKKN